VNAETWKPVVGWEGLYEVSDHGRVRSLDRVTVKGKRYGQIMKPLALDTGHLRVRLSREGRGSSMLVHRLVLEAFRGLCPAGMEGCHNDGHPENNALSNLRWDTRSNNLLDSVTHGTHVWARRTHCPKRHRLITPNITRFDAQRGRRSCLACNRARSIARNYDIPFTQELSDLYYWDIMMGAAA
jgi:hypothetical protein